MSVLVQTSLQTGGTPVLFDLVFQLIVYSIFIRRSLGVNDTLGVGLPGVSLTLLEPQGVFRGLDLLKVLNRTDCQWTFTGSRTEIN